MKVPVDIIQSIVNNHHALREGGEPYGRSIGQTKG
jgi:hypothetical protein